MRTLTAPQDIDRLFKHGRRASDPLLVLLASTPGEGRDVRGRVMFVAGKKLGNAVVRNRCKRVMREAARHAGAPWPGLDVAVMARVGTATAGHEELASALDRLLAKLGIPRS